MSSSQQCVCLLFLVLLIECTQQQQECADMPHRAVISRVDSQNNCQVNYAFTFAYFCPFLTIFGLFWPILGFTFGNVCYLLFGRLGTASITPSKYLMKSQL